MRVPRVRLTIRSMMLVLIGVALSLWLGRSAMPRPPITVSTVTSNGITFRLSHPRLTPEGSIIGGTGQTKRGRSISWVSWADGFGGGEMLEYDLETMRLRVGDLDYGPIQQGDVVEYRSGEVLVNGRARTPVTARPRKGPPVWYGPNYPVPADVVFPL